MVETMAKNSILIVEDEFLIAKGLARKLEKLGYVVLDTVASGTEAIALVSQRLPDLILMDIVLEGELDGIETAEKLQAIAPVPIVFVTAYADDETLGRLERANSYGYILKPFKEREVHGAIKIALHRYQRDQSAQARMAHLDHLNQRKNQYLSFLAHELRNPLSSIHLSADLLHNHGAQWQPYKRDRTFEIINRSVKNIDELIAQTLLYSRMELDKLRFNPQKVDLQVFGRDLLKGFESLAQAGQRLQFHCDLDSAIALVDQDLLKPILGNLISNAIKYSPQGGTITLAVATNPPYLLFSVTDQGLGIPPSHYEQVWQEFERADNVQDIEGHGLGLAIVKQAVQCHQGTIYFTSELNQGTTFTVSVPYNAGD